MASASDELRSIAYDAAVDFQGAVRTALLARWSKAQVVYGDAKPREGVAKVLYTRRVTTTGAHVVEQALSLAQAMIPNSVPMSKAEFPVDPDADARITPLAGDARDFAILNPGAGWARNNGPPIATAWSRTRSRKMECDH